MSYTHTQSVKTVCEYCGYDIVDAMNAAIGDAITYKLGDYPAGTGVCTCTDTTVSLRHVLAVTTGHEEPQDVVDADGRRIIDREGQPIDLARIDSGDIYPEYFADGADTVLTVCSGIYDVLRGVAEDKPDWWHDHAYEFVGTDHYEVLELGWDEWDDVAMDYCDDCGEFGDTMIVIASIDQHDTLRAGQYLTVPAQGTLFVYTASGSTETLSSPLVGDAATRADDCDWEELITIPCEEEYGDVAVRVKTLAGYISGCGSILRTQWHESTPDIPAHVVVSEAELDDDMFAYFGEHVLNNAACSGLGAVVSQSDNVSLCGQVFVKNDQGVYMACS